MRKIDWSHHNPVQIHSGKGSLMRLAECVPVDCKVLVVTSSGFAQRGIVETVIDLLGAPRVLSFAEVAPNPELDDLDRLTERFSCLSVGALVAIGGGSVLDAAKVLSVTLPCAVMHPLHTALRGGVTNLWARSIPVIAVPTTAGTGAELTPFATVWDKANHKKHSVTGRNLYPRVALLDPNLTLTLPAEETLYTGLDAVSHSLESLWNKNRTPLSEAFATQALRVAMDALPGVLAHPSDLSQRARMQEASALAGLAISQTRTAIAHSISYPLTTHYGVPHGLACSFTLENVISLYLEQNPNSRFKTLMSNIQEMLRRFDLFSHLERYADERQVSALEGEMLTPGRAENFDGQIVELKAIIFRSA